MEIRRITETDIDRVVELHRKTLPCTMSSRLGKNFLKRIYLRLLKYPDNHIALCISDRKKIVAVATLTLNFRITNLTIGKLDIVTFSEIVVELLLLRIKPKEVIQRLQFEYQISKTFVSAYLYILTFFVDDKYQGQGIGKKLLNEVLALTKKKKAKHLYVDTQIKNKQALGFYLKNGFKKISQITDSFLLEHKI